MCPTYVFYAYHFYSSFLNIHIGLVAVTQVYDSLTKDFENNCWIAVHAFFRMPEIVPNGADGNETTALCRRARTLFFGGGSIDPDGTGNKLVEVSSPMLNTFMER